MWIKNPHPAITNRVMRFRWELYVRLARCNRQHQMNAYNYLVFSRSLYTSKSTRDSHSYYGRCERFGWAGDTDNFVVCCCWLSNRRRVYDVCIVCVCGVCLKFIWWIAFQFEQLNERRFWFIFVAFSTLSVSVIVIYSSSNLYATSIFFSLFFLSLACKAAICNVRRLIVAHVKLVRHRLLFCLYRSTHVH